MPWLESHTIILRHRKNKDLATRLKIRAVYCMGHMHALWHAALEQQEDGDLSKWSDDMIAEGADYRGDSSKFVAHLQGAGWMTSGRLLHDWLDYAGRYLESKYRSSAPDRLRWIWNRHGRAWDKAPGRPVTRQSPASDNPVNPGLPQMDSGLPQMDSTSPNGDSGLQNKERFKKSAQSHLKDGLKPDFRLTQVSPPYLTSPTLPTLPTLPSAGKQNEVYKSPEDFNGRQRALEHARLLALKMPFGEYEGVPVSDIDPQRAIWLLTAWKYRAKLHGDLKAALELKAQLKRGEMTEVQRNAADEVDL